MRHRPRRYLRKTPIRDVLKRTTGWGWYSRTVTFPEGSVVTHRFSLATGMASSHFEGKYLRHFGEEPPAWTALEHPYHQRCLYELAVTQNRLLPAHRPTIERNEP